MGLLGWAIAGGSGFGPSKLFDSMPYKNWRELTTWVEEYIDAIGYRLDVLNQRFISPAARARLLDPTITPTDSATTYLATATSPALNSTSSDTMLDVLLAIALGLYPADSNLTVAQKQALVQVGWDALQRKGTRLRLLNVASKVTDGVVFGWSVAPNNFSMILSDGAPASGYGNWVQANNTTPEVIRPWVLSAVRSTTKTLTPDFINYGVGYSQFRAGYSSAGEVIMPVDVRLNLLANEHFSTWTSGVPNNWTKTGASTLTQSTSAASINWEFTGSAAVLDLSAAAILDTVGLQQLTTVNNQLAHRFQMDYAYTNTQGVGVLAVQVTDANPNGTTYYWNPTTATWGTAAYSIIAPVSASRGRLAFDITPQLASATTTLQGTTGITVKVFVTCDGTATTKTAYTIYRVGIYEKFSLAIEQAAQGERTAWYPLIDAPGWTAISRTSAGNTVVEPANAQRTAYKTVSATLGSFPYHAALSRRSFLSTGTWTNLLKGSNSFTGGDWTNVNSVSSGVSIISPLIGETVATAPKLNANATGAYWGQGSLGVPTNKSYVCGVWVNKQSTDGNYTDVTLSLVSNSTKSQTFTVKQAQGWVLLPFRATFGGSDVTQLEFRIGWGSASSNGQIALASAYCYDVTGKPAVLYPPVCQSAVGSTGIVKPTSCQATVAVSGAGLLHPLTQRPLASTVRGSFGAVIVPTFDASSQPDGVIFDVAQTATTNRVVLRVNTGALELKRWDAAGNTWTASLALSAAPTPASGSMTWLRDTAITVRAFWDENSTMLSAANGNASGTKPGSWAPSDASLVNLTVGCDFQLVNQFEGLISDS
jgi:hypothetical protein